MLYTHRDTSIENTKSTCLAKLKENCNDMNAYLQS